MYFTSLQLLHTLMQLKSSNGFNVFFNFNVYLSLYASRPLLHIAIFYLRRCFSSSMSIWTPSLITSLSTTTHYRHFLLTSSTPTVVTSSLFLPFFTCRHRPLSQFSSSTRLTTRNFKLQTFFQKLVNF